MEDLKKSLDALHRRLSDIENKLDVILELLSEPDYYEDDFDDDPLKYPPCPN